MGGAVSMRRSSKLSACCAVCVLLATFPQLHAQGSSSAKKHSPTDSAATELNRLLVAAQEAVDKQDFEAAAQNYEQYLAKKPDDATVHYDLGYVYTALERRDDAKAEYEKAIDLDPQMGPAYKNLGLTLLASDPAAAVAPLQRASELLPDDPRTKWLLATALEKSGQGAAAIDEFQAAEKLDDKDIDIRESLAFALYRAGRLSEAETAYRGALSLQPDGAALQKAHLGLANSLVADKKLDEAASEFAAYLELAPNDTATRIERASALVDLGKDDDALGELDRAAAAGPEGIRQLKLRSQIYWEKKRYDEAIPVLQKAAAIAPSDPDIPARLGRVYMEKKDYLNAVHWFAAAYKMNPTDNDLLVQVIEAQYLNQNYAAALGGLDALSKREELPLGSVYLRATCYDKLGQLEQALDAYQKFLQLNKDGNSDMYFVSTSRVRALTRELKDKKR